MKNRMMLQIRLLFGLWYFMRTTSSSLSSNGIVGGEPRMIRGVPVTRTNLRNGDPSSPYCFSVSSIATLDPSSNFLATQVWPSARLASLAVKEHAEKHWNVCEFGCGPGLPSLTAACLGCSVVATDLDDFALELVRASADEQGWDVKTRKFDLVVDCNDQTLKAFQESIGDDEIDLVIFSDVFENGAVAKGAAAVTKYFLDRGSRVWTFAQSDRAQRDEYTKELSIVYQPAVNDKTQQQQQQVLAFQDTPYNPEEKLWLCDLDETKVVYG